MSTICKIKDKWKPHFWLDLSSTYRSIGIGYFVLSWCSPFPSEIKIYSMEGS